MAERKEKVVKIGGEQRKLSLIPTIILNTESFIEECSNNKEQARDAIKQQSSFYEKKRKAYIKYNQFGEEYVSSLTIWGNEDYYVGDITFNYEEFMIKLQRLLSVEQIVDINSPDFEKVLNDRIEKLSQVKTLDELHQKFPNLYRKYLDGNSMLRLVEAITDFKPETTSSIYESQVAEAKYKKNYYYSCGLRRNVEKYIETQVEMITHVLHHIKDLAATANSFSIGNRLAATLDKEKTMMYIAMHMIDECQNCKDPEQVEVYLKTLKRYFSKSHEGIIVHDEKGQEVTYRELLQSYNSLIKKGDISLEWIIMPRGKEEKQTASTQTRRRIQKEIDPKIIELNDRKIKFYDSLSYLGRAKGMSNNRGYTAFFLPNSQILLDKVAYSEAELLSAYGNAIYNMNTDNFELLSQLSKKQLRQDRLCPIYPHNGEWEIPVTVEVVHQIITEGTLNKTRELIRKLERQK